MSSHPSTIAAEPPHDDGAGWNDCATLHLRDGGGGLLHAMKRIRSGTLAELVAFVATLPAEEREAYMIEKAGDRQYLPREIAALALRPDFPLRAGADFPLQSGNDG